MVTLPGEDAVASDPNNVPRRWGTPSWQPDTISRATGQFGQGMETLGRGISQFGDEQAKNMDNLAQANAQSQFEVGSININAAVAKATDPDQLATFKDQHTANLNDAAASIANPATRQLFMARNAPNLARNQVEVANRVRTLDVGNQIAGADQFTTTAIGGAIASDDPATQNQVMATINQRNAALRDSGYITPQEYQTRVSAAAKSYVDAKKDYLIQDAEARAQSGDPDPTARLRAFLGTQPFPGAAGADATGPVNMTIPPEGRALLATIAGPESAGKYNVRYTPQGGAPFAGYADHPRIKEAGPEGPSDAAGGYQMLSSTWDTEARKLGLTNFSPANQDAAAWDLAQTAYKQSTGGDLLTALQSHDPRALSGVAQALKGQWPSLPGGSEQGTTSSKFIGDFAGNLQKAAQTGTQGAGPFVGLPPAPGPTTAGAVQYTDPDTGKVMTAASMAQVPNGAIIQRISAAGQVAGPGVPSVVPDTFANAPASKGAVQYRDPTSGQLVTVANMAQVPPGALPPGGVTPAPRAGAVTTDSEGNAINPETGRANLSLVPDRSKWPAGTDHVQANGDGSLSYVDKDGGVTPVPGSTANGAPGLPAPQRPTGSLLDALHPTDHATANLEVQQAIDRIQRQQEQQAKQQSSAAIADMRDISGRVISGDPTINDQTFAQYRRAYSASPDPDVRRTFAMLDAARNTIKTFVGESPATIRAKVDNMQADYQASVRADPQNPLNDLKASALQASSAYLTKYEKDISTNFYGRAAQEIGINIRPIDPADPNLSGAIAKRVSDAQTASQFFGVPPQYFTKEEKASLKQVSKVGGQPMIDFATAMTNGAGPAAGAMLNEIGGAAPALGEIGRLAAAGSDPDTVSSLADYERASNDKDARGTIPRISDHFLYETGARALNDPFSNALDGLGVDQKSRWKATANRLMSAEALDNNLDLSVTSDQQKINQDFADRNADKAVGAVMRGGATYGGIAKDSGWSHTGNVTISPNNIKKDDFFDVVHSLTDGELAKMPPTSTGQPMTAQQLKNARLVAVPDAQTGMVDGGYSLIATNSQGKEQVVTGQNGKPWVLDMKSFEPVLRQRLPGSYLGGAQAPQPAPMPYRGVHGIQGVEAANEGGDRDGVAK